MDRLKGHLCIKGEKGDPGEIGTPKVYQGEFTELQADSRVDKDFHYVIVCDDDQEYNRHWVFYDDEIKSWRDGGLYGAIVTYKIEKTGSEIKLVGSDGSISSVTVD